MPHLSTTDLFLFLFFFFFNFLTLTRFAAPTMHFLFYRPFTSIKQLPNWKIRKRRWERGWFERCLRDVSPCFRPWFQASWSQEHFVPQPANPNIYSSPFSSWKISMYVTTSGERGINISYKLHNCKLLYNIFTVVVEQDLIYFALHGGLRDLCLIGPLNKKRKR